MKDELQTLSKLFSERLFRIPDYQRGYAWNENQLDDFWSDIQQLSGNDNHYTGVVTLEAAPQENVKLWEEDQWIINSRRYEPLYIVDGQQRLTTSIIAISCIANILERDDDELNFTSKKDILRKYVFDRKSGGPSRSYIFGYERDNPSYEYLKTEIFGEDSASDRSEQTIYTHNLSTAKRFFEGKLKDLNESEVEDLFIKITQHLLFNVFTISDDVEVCVAFETMNNRGKKLSHLELLKNRLIYLTTRVAIDDGEALDMRRTVNECWKALYHNLGRNKEKPLDDDFFLRSHYFLNFVEPSLSDEDGLYNPEELRKIYRAANEDTYKELLSNLFTFKSLSEARARDVDADEKLIESIYKYVNSLQVSVKLWFEIFNPERTNDQNRYEFWLAKLNRIPYESVYPVLLSVMLATKNSVERREAFKAIERSIVVDYLRSRWYGPQGISPYAANRAIRLGKGEITISEFTSEILEETDRILAGPYALREIKEQLKNRNYYTWKLTRYMLFEYNLELQINSKTEREKINWESFAEVKDDYTSIEHIYPQQARLKYWRERFKDLTPSQRDILRNSIGNLLPLSRAKNSSLSNKSFDDKVGRVGETVGFRFGSYAENEVASNYSEWTPKTIADRGLQMLDFIEARWGLNFGKDSDKKELLGLKFVDLGARITARRFDGARVKMTKSKRAPKS